MLQIVQVFFIHTPIIFEGNEHRCTLNKGHVKRTNVVERLKITSKGNMCYFSYMLVYTLFSPQIKANV